MHANDMLPVIRKPILYGAWYATPPGLENEFWPRDTSPPVAKAYQVLNCSREIFYIIYFMYPDGRWLRTIQVEHSLRALPRTPISREIMYDSTLYMQPNSST